MNTNLEVQTLLYFKSVWLWEVEKPGHGSKVV